MMSKGNHIRRQAGVVVLVLAMLVSAGCEPLRKKFVRQRKQPVESSEMVPVLDPVDYPAKIETTESLYSQQFRLWSVWHSEVLRDLEDRASERKIRFDFDKMLTSLGEMKRLLQGVPEEELTRIVGKIQDLRRQLDKPEGLRDDASILRKLDSLGRTIKRDFKPGSVSEAFVP